MADPAESMSPEGIRRAREAFRREREERHQATAVLMDELASKKSYDFSELVRVTAERSKLSEENIRSALWQLVRARHVRLSGDQKLKIA